MKLKTYIGLAVGVLAMAGIAKGTVTINMQYGVATNAAGAAVADNTLWILVVDSNANNSFAGGMATNSNLAASTVDAINAAFQTGQTLTVGGLLGGDTIFAMGGFTGSTSIGAGTTDNALNGLALGTNGLTSGASYAFYYFPGVTYTGATTYQVGSQVGGVQINGADAGAGTGGMVIGADGSTLTQGANTTDPVLGGSLSPNAFKAVTLVPEPSAALLGMLGALGLLRRRR